MSGFAGRSVTTTSSPISRSLSSVVRWGAHEAGSGPTRPRGYDERVDDLDDPGDPLDGLRAEVLPSRAELSRLLDVVSGAPDRALPFFEAALGLDPKEEDMVSIYSYMGVCLKDMEAYREAIEKLETAESLDTERTDVHNLMGFCYFKLKEHEKAIECFRNVLKLDPTSAIDYANIASNYRDMGNRDEAIRHYRLAIELDPSIDFARDNLERLEKGE